VLRLLSDENLHGDIVRGHFRAMPDLDLVRFQDAGLSEADDPAILEWAAEQGRIVLTHDRKTIPGFAYERVIQGEPMSGVFLISDSMPIGQAIAEILLAVEGSEQEEWNGLVTYFPL
jgi:predicted nuclease of predicted toxin-antitoxin system